MQRAPVAKRLAITRRDLEIMRVLSGYRYLSSTFLHAFVGGASETRFKERLRDLFDAGLVGRPEAQWRLIDARSVPTSYEITERGERLLASQIPGDTKLRTYLRGVGNQFAHSRLVCEVIASLELACRGRSDIRLLCWSEILARVPAATASIAKPFAIPFSDGGQLRNVVPDGLFALEYTVEQRRSYRFFALEVDRATMPIVRSDEHVSSYLAKLRGYAKIVELQVHKRHLGVSTLFVLTVTTNREHLAEIIRRAGGAGLGGNYLFQDLGLVRAVSALRRPNLSLMTEPWQRLGRPPLRIAIP